MNPNFPVNDNSELVQLAKDLIDKIEAQPGGESTITQSVSQVKYAATSATGNASIGNITDHETTETN